MVERWMENRITAAAFAGVAVAKKTFGANCTTLRAICDCMHFMHENAPENYSITNIHIAHGHYFVGIP